MAGLGKRSLKQTDSFNSSGATIRPDFAVCTETRGTGEAHDQLNTNNLRLLSSQDSVGRDFDDALGAGEDAMLREYAQPHEQTQSTGFSRVNSLNASGSFAFDLPPTLLSPDPAPLHSASHSPKVPQPTTSPTNLHISPAAELPVDARPASVHSYRTGGDSLSGAGSEYSFSTTDVSEDHDMALAEQGDRLTELNLQGMALGEAQIDWSNFESVQRHLNGIDPRTFAQNNSPQVPTPGQSPVEDGRRGSRFGGGPMRGVAASPSEDTEAKRLERLEHRRSINRKSAQKHRLRRREELEELNEKITQRDARIAQLERDLAVERAKLQQVMQFFQDRARAADSAQALQGNAADSAESRRKSSRNRADA